MQTEQTLVLSRSYEPVDVVPWHQAITMMFLGKAEVVEEYDREVRSTYLVVKMPAVVRLLSKIRRERKPVKFSRVNIYGRDGYRCQYCGVREKMPELTYDHVLPRSRGGKTDWNNIVTCCVPCNERKRDRTPAEAGMRLRRQPVQPSDLPSLVVCISRESAPAAWRDYLYWTGELDRS